MAPLPPPPPYSPTDPHGSSTVPELPASAPAARTGAASNLLVPDPSSVRPQHDYSSYEQTSPSLTSPSYGDDESTLFPTPPRTPDIYSHQLNNVEGIDGNAVASAAVYFDTRPTIMRRPSDVLSYQLTIPPNAQPETVTFPEPAQRWLARDVSHLDWTTFTNYLFPQHLVNANSTIADRKLRTEQEWIRSVDVNAGSNGAPSPIEAVTNQLSDLPGLDATSEKKMMAMGEMPEPEKQRRQRIEAVVADWNEGFFQPRGLNIQEHVMPYEAFFAEMSAETLVNGNEPLPQLTEEERRSQTLPSERGPLKPWGKRGPGSCSTSSSGGPRGHQWGHSRGGAWGHFGESGDCSSRSSARTRVPERDGNSHVALNRSGCSSGRRRFGDGPTRRRSSSVSSSSTTSSASSSHSDSTKRPRASMDTLDFSDLRTALANFLIKSSSREDTVVAIDELSKELRGQRIESVRALRHEIKATKKEYVEKKKGQHSQRLECKAARQTYRDQKREQKKTQQEAKREQKEAKRELKRAAKIACKGKGKCAFHQEPVVQVPRVELDAQQTGVLTTAG
ncbi:MAG: hypothetical protein M1833_004841 [Piccolia ochrophora]|nr:MAG: hypothetical protein M1833_004841 [Piccolia ochrophora]